MRATSRMPERSRENSPSSFMAMAISPLFESRFIDPNSSARLVTFPTIMCLTLGQKLATRERKKTPAPPFLGIGVFFRWPGVKVRHVYSSKRKRFMTQCTELWGQLLLEASILSGLGNANVRYRRRSNGLHSSSGRARRSMMAHSADGLWPRPQWLP